MFSETTAMSRHGRTGFSHGSRSAFPCIVSHRYVHLCGRIFQAYGWSQGMSPYVSFKKNELLRVTGSFAGDVKADQKAETFTCMQVGSPAAAYDWYDFVVVYREIGHIHSLHEAFGLKISI